MKENLPQIFTHDNLGSITAIEKNGEPWFVAKEIAEILEYSGTDKLTRRLEDDEKATHPFRVSPSNVTQKTLINESGLYEAIFGSHMPKAKEFKRWVKREVLPAIRKTGGFSVGDGDMNIPLLTQKIKDGMTLAETFGISDNEARMFAARHVKDLTGVDFSKYFPGATGEKPGETSPESPTKPATSKVLTLKGIENKIFITLSKPQNIDGLSVREIQRSGCNGIKAERIKKALKQMKEDDQIGIRIEKPKNGKSVEKHYLVEA